MNYDEYLEVVITDADRKEFFYWILTDDEDEAVSKALERHVELGLSYIDDEDEGVFPMAYEVIEANKEVATVIE